MKQPTDYEDEHVRFGRGLVFGLCFSIILYTIGWALWVLLK